MYDNKMVIKCPNCQWQPKGKARWRCTCGQVWNTFETVAVCPGCQKKWMETQCPACHEWTDHDDWYTIPVNFHDLMHNLDADNVDFSLTTPAGAYHMPDISLSVMIKRKARGWVSNRSLLFQIDPEIEQRWMEVFLNEPEQLIAIELGMQQLADETGFSDESPLEHVGMAGLTCLISLLALRKGCMVTEYTNVEGGFRIEKQEVGIKNSPKVFIYNKVKSLGESPTCNLKPYSFEDDPNCNFISSELVSELRNLKMSLESQVFANPTPFETYIKKWLFKDLKGMMSKTWPDFYFGGTGWANMEMDLSKVNIENRKYFCVCLFGLEIYRKSLVEQCIDGFISIQHNKGYPKFGSYINDSFESEAARFLLEKPEAAGVDFNIITDYELEEFVDDACDLIDYTLNGKNMGEKIIAAILNHPEFNADCKVFQRIKAAVNRKLKTLKR